MGKRGHESFSNHRHASGPVPAANRRTVAPFRGLPESDGHAGAVFEGPPSIYQVLHVQIDDLDDYGIGFGPDTRSWRLFG